MQPDRRSDSASTHRHRRVVAVGEGGGRLVSEDEGEVGDRHHARMAFEQRGEHAADEPPKQRPAGASDIERGHIVP